MPDQIKVSNPEPTSPRPIRRGLVFDLDGTLLDTLEDIGNAANAVLVQHGYPAHPISAYRGLVGEGVQMLLTRALPENRRDEANVRACMDTMKIEYPRHLNKTARPYPGIPEILSKLKQSGLQLAVLSNKPHEYAGRCVADFFGREIFDPILGLRDGVPRKPDPAGAAEIARLWGIAPAEIFYLGDSGTDMKTAAAAGMFPVGVLWGYRGESELRESGARLVIRSPAEILRLQSLAKNI